MKKFICITIAILIALPLLCQEEKLKKLENLENNTGIKTVADSTAKSETVTITKSEPDSKTGYSNS